MSNDQHEMQSAPVEPDDPEIGTVNESTPETTPEPVVEPAAEPVTEPETPDPEGGEPEPEPDDKLKDALKSKAYFQQKSQVETEERKRLEVSLAEMTADLQERDPSTDYVPLAEPETPEAPAVEPPEAGDDDEFSAEKIADAAANRVMGKIDARDRAKAQAEVDRKYAVETKGVKAALTKLAVDHEIPNDIVLDGLKYAQRFVDVNLLGGPTLAAELAGEYIRNNMTARATKARTELATKAAAEADLKKVTAAATVAQPAGGGIAAPAPSTPESINAQLADEFADDDAF